MTVSFFVPGKPETKGSTKSFRHAKTGRIITRNDNPKAKGFAQRIALAAGAAMGGAAPIDGPCRVELTFTLPRPKCRKKDVFHQTKPDIDKLTRNTLDALSSIVYGDDKQVVSLICSKEYEREAKPPGVMVSCDLAEVNT